MPWDDAIPYGIQDIKLTGYTNSTTLEGTSTDLPRARTMSFEESEEFTELRGDNKVVAIVGQGAVVEWELEAGGVNTNAYKKLAGGATVTSGTTPAQITTYTKKVTDVRPYFKAEGQAINDLGGDFHGILYKARASDNISGELNDGEFFLTEAGGQALPALLTGKVDYLYEFVLNETATPIA